MRYTTLDAVVPFAETNGVPPDGAFLLVADTLAADGSCILHHFVSNHLKARDRVVLVAFSQTFTHYMTISRKLGTDLTQEERKGTFVFVNAMNLLLHLTRDIPDAAGATRKSSTEMTDNILKHLYKLIRPSVENTPADKRALLVLDDLSMLLFAGSPAIHVLEFFHALRILLDKHRGALIGLAHADNALFGTSDQDVFLKSLMYQAEYVMSVRGLQSGFSRDVSGEISLSRGPRNRDVRYKPLSLHYKIFDKNIRFFAKGLSPGVL